jgi:hypothetical protein
MKSFLLFLRLAIQTKRFADRMRDIALGKTVKRKAE